MAPRITHTKVTGKPAGGDATRVYGSDWDADHTLEGLTPGVDVQAYSVAGQALAGTTPAADQVPYFNGTTTAASAPFTAAGRAMAGAATAAAQTALLSNVTGDSGSGGVKGLVPAPAAGDAAAAKFLSAYGDFRVPAASVTPSGTPVAGQVARWTSASAVEGFSLVVEPQGRLTLASATPYMDASQGAKTTHFFTPILGNNTVYHDGTRLLLTTFTELSQAGSDTTKSPAAIAASKLYDIFQWMDSSTLRATRGPAYTTSRGTGAGTSELTFNTTYGLWFNTNAITNGPAAGRGLYVGTIGTNGSAQYEYIVGAGSSGGTAGSLLVWNLFNRRWESTTVTDNGANYNYSSTTIRQARASAGNQVSFIIGLDNQTIDMRYTNAVSLGATSGAQTRFGFGTDSVTTYFNDGFYLRQNQATNSLEGGGTTSGLWKPSTPGLHYVAALEDNPSGLGTTTFNLRSNAQLTVSLFN